MGKYINDLIDTILDKLNVKNKERVKSNFKKYNFIIIFGFSFSLYLVIFSIQSILGSKKDDVVAVNSNEQTTQATQTTQAVQQTQSQIVTGEITVTTNSNGTINGNQQVVTDTNGMTIANQNQQLDNNTQQTTMANNIFTTVDESYLDGALFIGDSRSVALQMYGGLANTNFFVSTGMSIWKVMDSAIANVNGKNMTVDAALQVAKYNKIYIMLGINEVGTGTPDTFLQQYQVVVNRIKELQPQAIIYVQSIMHVTQSKDSAGTSVNNNNINARNEKLKTLADNVNVFWLDENEVFDVAGTGKLNPEYTSDGVHLKANYIQLWIDYLLSHAIVR